MFFMGVLVWKKVFYFGNYLGLNTFIVHSVKPFGLDEQKLMVFMSSSWTNIFLRVFRLSG